MRDTQNIALSGDIATGPDIVLCGSIPVHHELGAFDREVIDIIKMSSNFSLSDCDDIPKRNLKDTIDEAINYQDAGEISADSNNGDKSKDSELSNSSQDEEDLIVISNRIFKNVQAGKSVDPFDRSSKPPLNPKWKELPGSTSFSFQRGTDISKQEFKRRNWEDNLSKISDETTGRITTLFKNLQN